MCVSSEGVGLDGSATDNDALDVAGVGLTSATWGACGLSVKVRVRVEQGRKGWERGGPVSLIGPRVGGGGAASALDIVVFVSTSSAGPGSGSTGSRGAGDGGQRRGEWERERNAVKRATKLPLLSAWEPLM